MGVHIDHHHHHPVPQRLVGACRHLRTLDLSYCGLVGDRVVGWIAVQCPRLVELRLKGCDRLTDRGVLELAWHARNLSTLDLSLCRKVGDHAVATLLGLEPMTTMMTTTDPMMMMRRPVEDDDDDDDSSATTATTATYTTPADRRRRRDVRCWSRARQLARLDVSWCLQISRGLLERVELRLAVAMAQEVAAAQERVHVAANPAHHYQNEWVRAPSFLPLSVSATSMARQRDIHDHGHGDDHNTAAAANDDYDDYDSDHSTPLPPPPLWTLRQLTMHGCAVDPPQLVDCVQHALHQYWLHVDRIRIFDADADADPNPGLRHPRVASKL